MSQSKSRSIDHMKNLKTAFMSLFLTSEDQVNQNYRDPGGGRLFDNSPSFGRWRQEDCSKFQVNLDGSETLKCLTKQTAMKCGFKKDQDRASERGTPPSTQQPRKTSNSCHLIWQCQP